jgi:molybdopterin-guanine dinucleotide biosynthesis protein A
VLQRCCSSVLSVGAALPGCVPVSDEQPGLGPLGGLLSGLRASPTDWCLLAAADMPSLDPDVLAVLWRERQAPATVPVLEEPEPLLALYHRELIPSLEAYLQTRRSARGWLATLEYKKVPGLPPETFRNVNYPEELLG